MSRLSPSALSRCVREVIEFVDAAGWDTGPQVFALVPTAELLTAQPELTVTLAGGAELTPVAQDALPTAPDGSPQALDEALATLEWPAAVAGCALVQEIVILPPSVESELESGLSSEPAAGDARTLTAAAEHPERREARLVAGVLRGGESLCLLQLRGESELLEHPELAPNLVAALQATLEF